MIEKVSLLKSVENLTTYSNQVISEVNDHVVRLAVIDGEYHWHHHETDETFLVIEGTLFIDFKDQPTVTLDVNDMCTVPAFVAHRTWSNTRTVNLCFEKADNDIRGQ